MAEPLFWLGLSILLVAVSLTAVLMAALPAFQELARAARSAEKLFDTLSRELPPTLEAVRLTGIELTNLTDDVGQNVQTAGRVVGQIDQSITGVKQQAKQAQVATQSVAVGLKAAWQAFRRSDIAQPQASTDQELHEFNARRFSNSAAAFDPDHSDHENPLESDVSIPLNEQKERLMAEPGTPANMSSPAKKSVTPKQFDY